MATITTFSCGHTATTYSTHTPNPHLPNGTKSPPPSSIPFPCRPCARDEAALKDAGIKAVYDPRITDLNQCIQRSSSRGRDSWDAVNSMKEERLKWVLEKEERLRKCWAGYVRRWL